MSSSGKQAGGGDSLWRLNSGQYYSSFPWSGRVANLGTDQRLCASSFPVANAVTISRIGIEITTAGSAGSVIRLGLYRDTGAGYPGALLLDAGTIDGTQAPGFYEITINQALGVGLFWLAEAQQGAPVTATAVRTCNTTQPMFLQTTGLGATNPGASATGLVKGAGAAGAFPDPYPAGAVTVGLAPVVAVKVA